MAIEFGATNVRLGNVFGIDQIVRISIYSSSVLCDNFRAGMPNHD